MIVPMSDFTARARVEAKRRWTFETAAYDSLTIDQRRGRRIGFELGALWAAEQDPTDAEVEAGARAAMENWREQTPTGMFLPDWYGTDEEDRQQWRAFIRVALIAARDARLGADG